MMGSSTNLLTTLSSAVGTLLALAIEIGLLVIALAIVKPRRPDAAMPFVIGAAVNAIATLMWPLLTSFVFPFLRTEASGSISAVYAVFGLFFSLIRTVGWGIVLFGVVKLANPPGGGQRDPTRYG